jgi:N-acyl-D-aspartate/D-glutamate deacylase
VVFDPDTVDSGPARLVDDMASGGARLAADSTGLDYVLVAGVDVVTDGTATGARPGRVLRSGTDTETVTLADVRR